MNISFFLLFKLSREGKMWVFYGDCFFFILSLGLLGERIKSSGNMFTSLFFRIYSEFLGIFEGSGKF